MNDGITMTMVLNLRPEVADRFWLDVASGIDGTRSFSGCRRAAMYRNEADPNEIMLTSEWDSHEDYKRYSAWRAASGRRLAGVPSTDLATLLLRPSEKRFWNLHVEGAVAGQR